MELGCYAASAATVRPLPLQLAALKLAGYRRVFEEGILRVTFRRTSYRSCSRVTFTA